MQMPGRVFSSGSYRYGFNGKENDNDVKGTGNQQDYGMRIYDPRLGKFLSVDPITKEYPELTPYQFASNTPIQALDLDGLEGVSFNDVMYGKANFVDWVNNPSPDGAIGKFNRNLNPVGIVATNGYTLISGKDFDTGEESSRVGAAINLFALYVLHKSTKSPINSAPQQLERQMAQNATLQGNARAITTAEQQEIKALIKQAEANGGKIKANVVKAAPKKSIKNSATHHIATNKNNISKVRGGPWTPRFKSIFDNAGLDINKGSENLVNVLNHKGPHPEEYHQLVFDRLIVATQGLKPNTEAYKSAVINTLNSIGNEAMQAGSAVNKLITKKP